MKSRYTDGVVTPQASDARASIAQELRAIRRSQHMTQQALADLAGTKRSNISRMESGSYNPSIDFLVKVASCLGKKIEIHLD